MARKADLPDGPVDIGLGGARGPGKSHGVLAQVGLDDCQRIDNLKGLFLRQTGIAAQESFDDLVDKVLRGKVKYTKSGQTLHLGKGGRIILGGFKDENDIDKYVGIEYDFIIVEELNQLSEDKYTKLRGSLRTSKPNWRPRMYTSFNPGGRGHGFVKKRYIIPFRNKEEKETRFIGSTYKSNPYLNKEYTQYLEGLTGNLGKAWREGEWDIFAGQVFTEWDYKTHVIEPFAIPHDWKRWIAMDWGTNAPFSVGWYAEDYDKRFYLYRELYMNGQEFEAAMGVPLTPKRLARLILGMNKKNGDSYEYCVADPSLWNGTLFGKMKDGQFGGKSIAETMMETGLKMIRADNDRINGLGRMREVISTAPDGKPYYQVFSTCKGTIETFPELIYDEHKIDDVNSNLNNDHCLSGNTLVDTLSGQKKISDLIGTSGYVYSIGGLPIKYHDCRLIKRNTSVVKVMFDNGKSITCTPDHKFITNKGIKTAEHLMGLRCYNISVNNNDSIWKFIKLVTPLKSSTVNDIINAVSTLEETENLYTESFGNITMEKSLRTLMFTIRTVTEAIITLIILNLFQLANTCLGILKETTTKTGLNQCTKEQMSGTNQKKGESVTKDCSMKSLEKSGLVKKSVNASFVERSSLHARWEVLRDSALSVASRKCVTVPEWIMSMLYAIFAKKILSKINIPKLFAVLEAVEYVGVKSVRILKQKQDVYCLVADKVHYFSVNDGLIVSNCYDRDRYMFMSRPASLEKSVKETPNLVREAFRRALEGDYLEEVD